MMTTAAARLALAFGALLAAAGLTRNRGDRGDWQWRRFWPVDFVAAFGFALALLGARRSAA